MNARFLDRFVGTATAALAVSFAPSAKTAAGASPAIVQSEFIVEKPLYRCSHASTIVETPDGLVAAWFGGSQEGENDVSIWLSRNIGYGWTPEEEVANGIDVKNRIRLPCWNPVLYLSHAGQLLLFYKVGPSPDEWWGMLRVSPDNGESWTKLKRLPDGMIGPVRNKPVTMLGGRLLCGSSTEDKGWRVHMEWTDNPLGLWWRTAALNFSSTVPAIQPTILKWGDWKYQLLCRTKIGWVYETWSTNNAASWSPLARTALPNPNSALDGVVLRDGRAVLVYNHTPQGRGVLNVAISRNGQIWQAAAVLENEPGSEFSYPAVIQTKDNLVHVTYTWKRERIKHVVLDPAKLQGTDMPDGKWPQP